MDVPAAPRKRSKGRPIHRLCKVCGAPFVTYAGHVNQGRGTVCSKACAATLGRAAAPHLPAPSPDRAAAQVRSSGLINARVKRGRLARPDRCSNCGKACRPDAHHDDYSKPAEVMFLCRSCHMKRHFWLLHQQQHSAEQSA
jgi:hypothetical protein